MSNEYPHVIVLQIDVRDGGESVDATHEYVYIVSTEGRMRRFIDRNNGKPLAEISHSHYSWNFYDGKSGDVHLSSLNEEKLRELMEEKGLKKLLLSS